MLMATLGSISFTTAITNSAASAVEGLGKVRSISLVCACTVVGGGTTAKAYVQTSLDGGVTWYDIASFAFTTSTAVKIACADTSTVATATPVTGSLADNTVQNGLIGDRLRVVVTTTGTYTAGSKIDVYYQTR
jgi:hypothetical protein